MKAGKLVRVPTVADLEKLGLAEAVEFTKAGKATHWKIKKKGYAAIQEAQKHNAPIHAAAEAEVAACRAALEAAYEKRRKLIDKAARLQG